MTRNDYCPSAIFNLAAQNDFLNVLKRKVDEKTMVRALFSRNPSSPAVFAITEFKERLTKQHNLCTSFFDYQTGCPDVLYEHNEQKVLIECKRFLVRKAEGSLRGIRTNGCDARNGLLQLLEYCTRYDVRDGILLVFDTFGCRVSVHTIDLVRQFHNFLSVEIHMIWLSANPSFNDFI